MSKTTRKQALLIARRLGCYGAHQHDDGTWMPCVDHETWEALRNGKPQPAKKVAMSSVIEHRAKMLNSKSRNLFPTREEALKQSRRNGCSGVRVVLVNGSRMYAACMPKNNGRPENTGMIPPSKDFEKLGEQGILGIDTLPGGGLVSAKQLGRSLSGRPVRKLKPSKPSTNDGDGDGFVTGPTGEDNVPAPKKPKVPLQMDDKPYKIREDLPGDGRVGFDVDPEDPEGNEFEYVRRGGKPRDGVPVAGTGLPEQMRREEGKRRIREIRKLRLEREDADKAKQEERMRKYKEISKQWEELVGYMTPGERTAGRSVAMVDGDIQEIIDIIESAKKRKKDFEKWGHKPDKPSPIDSDIFKIDAKGFVNYVSRSTDPDVFTDPDSARVRARQMGCIGIRSYTARDGKTVYLPCSNGSDYNRRLNLRPDGRPKKKTEQDMKSLAKTPAPKKDRIIGSPKNRVGSAGSIGAAGDIDLNETITASLVNKVREHNKAMKKANKNSWSMTNLRALKAVYRRGAGAFSVSHRPGMTRNQWAMGRVNAFLRLLSSGSAKASYITDNDLLPKGHPWKKKTIGSKSFFVDDVEYLAEFVTSGYSYRRKEAAKVNRYIIFPLDQDNS